MSIPKIGDWIRLKGSVDELGVGKIDYVDKEHCVVRFFSEYNDDGSPSFSSSQIPIVEFDEFDIITDEAEIDFFEKVMEREKKLQDLWPGWEGEDRDKAIEILLKLQKEEANLIDVLDEAIEYLSSLRK